MNASALGATLVDEHALRSLMESLVEAALLGRPPVDLVLQTHPLLEALDCASQVAEIEQMLESLLAERGLFACRTVAEPVAGSLDPVTKTLFYRPAEQILFEAVDEQHPIVLATTFEPQRYVDALIKRCDNSPTPQQLWIWKGASGRQELERADKDATPPWSFVFSDVPQPDLEQAFALANEQGGRLGVIEHDGSDISYVWFLATGGEPKIFVMMEERNGDEDNDQLIKTRIAGAILALVEANRDEFEINARVVLKTGDFAATLPLLVRLPPHTIVTIPDAHHFLNFDPGSPLGQNSLLNIGALKDVYHTLTKLRNGIKLILLCGEVSLPKDLREEVLRIDLPLPSRNELYVAIARTLSDDEFSDEQLVRLSEESAGMTRAEVHAVLARAQTASGSYTHETLLSALRSAKSRHIGRSPALELVEAGAMTKLGGMERFERWLSVRKTAFLEPERARNAGINRTPRGVLLMGVPGSGKSLAAKMIARDWALPLVKLDMGGLQDRWVGSSEARVREALRVVEAMAPCVLWIDEIDKGIAQGDGNFTHSSELNMRATLLTWMQENRHPVFIVATANHFDRLPPELTRAGRFDGRFFFGCSGKGGRDGIWRIHLRERGYNPDDFDLDELVRASHGFTGAEIEQVLLDSLYEAFDRSAPLTTEILVERAQETQPLIKAAGKSLEELWEMVEHGRVELASTDMLTRAQVASIIDPYLYRPVYCHLESIEGFRKQNTDAARLLMASPHENASAVVMETGEPDWLYVQTNVRRRRDDAFCFKFLDRFDTIENNFVFDALVSEHSLDSILFVSPAMRKRFMDSTVLSAYSELFGDCHQGESQ